MNKFLIIFFLSAFCCFYGQSQIQVNENSKSEKVSHKEDSILRKQFQNTFGIYRFDSEKNGLKIVDTKTLYRGNYKVTFSGEVTANGLPASVCYLTIEENKKVDYIDTIDFNSYAFVTSLNADIDIYDDKAYLCWVTDSDNPEDGVPSTIWLKEINLKKKNVDFFDKLYSQTWGIERISLVFNPFNDAIHIAYNDFSKQNSEYLFLGTISCVNLNNASREFSPKSILNEDVSEKRFPKFIRTDKSIFIYNTSGDTWGFFEHTGKQGIGISKIDRANNPSEYRILADSNTVNAEILLQHDVIYYQHVVGKNNGDFEIKKIKLSDLPNK